FTNKAITPTLRSCAAAGSHGASDATLDPLNVIAATVPTPATMPAPAATGPTRVRPANNPNTSDGKSCVTNAYPMSSSATIVEPPRSVNHNATSATAGTHHLATRATRASSA